MKNNFDTAAIDYDHVFTHSKIGRAQRAIVHNYLKSKVFDKKDKNILELNCGTGEDAYWLLKNNHKVLATDISQEMIKVASSKAKNEDNKPRFEVLDICKLDELKEDGFDLIFSNFGGLNCLNTEQIEFFIKIAYKKLKNKGKLVVVVMPKHCLWDKMYFLLKGKYKCVNRRATTNEVLVNIDGVMVPTYYYNPDFFIKNSKNKFTYIHSYPVGVIIPPSFMENFFSNKKYLFKLLVLIDKFFSNFSFLSKYSDHYIISLEKK